MSEPVKKRVKVINAKYVDEVDSIVILGECEDGRLTHQINRSVFTYGGRSESEIKRELRKTAEMMKGKTIWMEFNPEDGPFQDSPIILP